MDRIKSKLEFTAERNQAVMRSYRHALSKCEHIRLDDVLKQTVANESPRFWVSEERASEVVSAILRGTADLSKMRHTKRRMYLEIAKRVAVLRSMRPQATLIDLITEVVFSPAPEFYIEPRYARDIIYRRKR